MSEHRRLMRTLTFDQFEFDVPSSEEGLEIAIAARGDFPFPDVATFVSAVMGVGTASRLPQLVPFDERLGPGNVREYLRRYAGVALPSPCDWAVHVFTGEWNDWDAVLVGPSVFVRYHWWTTA